MMLPVSVERRHSPVRVIPSQERFSGPGRGSSCTRDKPARGIGLGHLPDQRLYWFRFGITTIGIVKRNIGEIGDLEVHRGGKALLGEPQEPRIAGLGAQLPEMPRILRVGFIRIPPPLKLAR